MDVNVDILSVKHKCWLRQRTASHHVPDIGGIPGSQQSCRNKDLDAAFDIIRISQTQECGPQAHVCM